MTNLLVSITDFFDGLQVREKLFLAIGAVVVILMLSVKILLPMWDSYNQLAAQKNTFENDFTWLQEQREAVVKLANNCPLIRQQRGADKSILTQLVRRNQLQLKAVTETANRMSISMAGGDSNRFLQLVHQIACRGFAVDSIAINPVENNIALLEATLEVRRVD